MKKILRLWQVKYFKNWFLLMVSFTMLEIIFRLNDKLEIISYQGLRIFLGINFLALFFSFILDYLPKLVAKIWNCLIVLVFSIYGIAQLGFNNYLGVYASLQIKTQASAVTSYVLDFIKSFNWTFYLMLIPFILLLVYYIFFDDKVDYDMPKKKVNFINTTIGFFKFLLIVFVGLLFFSTLKLDFMQNKRQATSSYDLFKKPSNPSLTLNEFGFIGFGLLDVKEYFWPGREIIKEVEYDPSKIPTNIENNDEPEEKVYNDHLTINNENWKDIIAKETNTKLNNINKYLISNRTTKENEYTGLFENKNLIVLMIESGSNIMLDETYYPNLSKLYKEGWHWKNYYSPRNSCSTGNNELSGLTSLYTIYNNCTSNVYKNNTYFESLFNLFNEKGYQTNSFHDHFDAYYYRTTIHKNLGSGAFYKVQNMGIKYGHSYGDWASDEEMMKYYLTTIDKLKKVPVEDQENTADINTESPTTNNTSSINFENTETTTPEATESNENLTNNSNETNKEKPAPFMSWITTVTSHMPYTDSSVYNKMYQDLFPANLSSDTKSYMSKLKVVDNAIGVLLEGLEERGILDDTVIVIYADHYPYSLSSANLEKVLNYDVTVDHMMDQVPFIIYNSETSKKEYEEYATYMNITPTLANLFNLNYDSRLYMGEDLLSNEYNSRAIFADGSWKNDVAYYDAGTNKIKYYTDLTYSDEEILAINEEIGLKLKMSSAIIKNNYFDYLNKKLMSYTTSN